MKAQDLIGFFSRIDYKAFGAGIALISSILLNVTQFFQMKDDGTRKDRELEMREAEIATLKKKVDKGNEIKVDDRNEVIHSTNESRRKLDHLDKMIFELEYRRDNILRDRSNGNNKTNIQDHGSNYLLDTIKSDLTNASLQASTERDRLVSLGKVLQCGNS